VDTVHECDRRTDGQTDRITIPKTVQRRASHGKNDVPETYYYFSRKSYISKINGNIAFTAVSKLYHLLFSNIFIVEVDREGGPPQGPYLAS